MPLFAPADVFQIAEASALPVHIVWGMARRRERCLCAGEHIAGERRIPRPLLMGDKRGGALERKGMHCYALRIEGKRSVKRLAKACGRILRKPGDEIHIDIGKAVRPRKQEGVLRTLRRVAAADLPQLSLIHI